MNGPAGRIGIIAGAGTLPGEVAHSVVNRGGSVHIIMLEGADPALQTFPHTRVNWAQLGRATAALKRADVRETLVLGAGARPSFRNARPDFAFIRSLPAVLRLLKAGGDDAVLRGLLGVLEAQGLTVVGVGDVARELLIAEGALTKHSPSPEDAADIEKGFALIAALGRYDIGQAAIVTDGRIEAIEGAEGTDRMLKRVAEARRIADRRGRRGVLVKRPKPGQDLRVDLPAIGPNTVRNADAAGLAGIAVMAGHVLAAKRSEMIAIADRCGLFIAGIEEATTGELSRRGAALGSARPVSLGAVRIGDRANAEIGRAAAILSDLAGFGSGSALVIGDGRVIAIGADEPPRAVIERAAGFRRKKTRREGVAAIGATHAIDEAIVVAASQAKLAGVVKVGRSADHGIERGTIRLADELGLFVATMDGMAEATTESSGSRVLKIFVVAGEHSGDALGAKLIAALKTAHDGPISFSGVGGEEMAREGFVSLFPIEDVAVMGPMSILPRLPRIVRRVYQTVDAALAAAPDAVVIIDSPEFTHPIAKRIRKRAPHIPIIDYVSPSVWAWRPGRAKRMRHYVDHVLALLPFEPDAHARLGGPSCTYVGHPLIEKLDEIQNADAAALARRLGLAPEVPVVLVLPGSRTSEVERLIDVFGEAVARVAASGQQIQIVIPAVRHVRDLIAARTAAWTPRPHIVDGAADKYAAMRLARVALAASGTVTLELALAQTPSVVAYKVDRIIASLRFLLRVPSVVLANLVLGRNVYPEFLQEDCTAEKLAAALLPLLADTEARKAQLNELARTPEKLRLSSSSPSAAAAETMLSVIGSHSAGKSRRGAPT